MSMINGGSILSFIPSLFFLSVGLFLFTTNEEFQIDIGKKHYTQSLVFFGIVRNYWQPLPEIEAVTVSPATLHYSIQDAIRPTINFKEEKYRVMLYVKNSERGIIVSYYNKDKALKVAEKVADYLNVPVDLSE
jgi:hypothetical protein